jgi:hypothetical protein
MKWGRVVVDPGQARLLSCTRWIRNEEDIEGVHSCVERRMIRHHGVIYSLVLTRSLCRMTISYCYFPNLYVWETPFFYLPTLV